MGQNAKSNAPQSDVVRQQIEGSLETIKEILVGEYAREFQKKLGTLEDRFSRELGSIQEQTAHRLEALEVFVRKELNFLRESIYEEMEKKVSALEYRKPDRQFIAGLLMRMAGALQAEPVASSETNITDLKTRVTKKSG